MKFELTPERRTELEPLLVELERWVQELEELDLADREPTLGPAHPGGTGANGCTS